MAKFKFKIGDKVQVIADDGPMKAGRICIVKGYWPRNIVSKLAVEFEDGSPLWEDNLRLANTYILKKRLGLLKD